MMRHPLVVKSDALINDIDWAIYDSSLVMDEAKRAFDSTHMTAHTLAALCPVVKATGAQWKRAKKRANKAERDMPWYHISDGGMYRV